MALPLAKQHKSSLSEGELHALIDAIHRGEHPIAIAKRLHPDNPKRARAIRRKLERECFHDPRIAEGVATKAHLDLMVGLGPTIKGMVKRAARGRTDAGRIVLEASGFHNPRVKHEHSGEITVKLDMPRPTFDGDAIEDADVVE